MLPGSQNCALSSYKVTIKIGGRKALLYALVTHKRDSNFPEIKKEDVLNCGESFVGLRHDYTCSHDKICTYPVTITFSPEVSLASRSVRLKNYIFIGSVCRKSALQYCRWFQLYVCKTSLEPVHGYVIYLEFGQFPEEQTELKFGACQSQMSTPSGTDGHAPVRFQSAMTVSVYTVHECGWFRVTFKFRATGEQCHMVALALCLRLSR